MKMKELLLADYRNVFRDPTLIMAAFAPILITLVVLFAFPLVLSFVQSRWGIDLGDYYRLFSLFMAFIIAMVYGIISAFIIIDERDEDILSFIRITPFSIHGYLLYRIGFALATALGALLFYLSILLWQGNLSLFDSLVLLCIVPLEAVCMALIVVSFAGNKVEGLAISKMVGLIPFSVVATYLIPGKSVWFFAIFPPFWIIKALESVQGKERILYTITAVVVHLVLVKFLVHYFFKKCR